MGNIFSVLGIPHNKLRALPDHLTEIIKRHIATGGGIVEAAVSVFFDHNRFDAYAAGRGIFNHTRALHNRFRCFRRPLVWH